MSTAGLAHRGLPAATFARGPATTAGFSRAGFTGQFQPTGVTCKKSVYLFANDYATKNVDEFCEDSAKGKNNALVSICAACGGWGLAVSPITQELAIGTNDSTVTLWTVAANGTITYTGSTLVLSQPGTEPLGICFDGTGGLYATDYSSNAIDYFDAAEVAGPGSSSPTGTWLTETNQINYYLACAFKRTAKGKVKNNILMADGVAKNLRYKEDFTLTYVSDTTPVGAVPVADSVSFDFGEFPPNVPGGLTLNKKNNLVVSNQKGYLYDMGTREVWANPPVVSCPDLGDYSGIVFDDKQDEIWADFITHSSPPTEAVSTVYPLAATGPCVTPGSSGGPAIPNDGEGDYLGIAVWPNKGV